MAKRGPQGVPGLSRSQCRAGMEPPRASEGECMAGGPRPRECVLLWSLHDILWRERYWLSVAQELHPERLLRHFRIAVGSLPVQAAWQSRIRPAGLGREGVSGPISCRNELRCAMSRFSGL